MKGRKDLDWELNPCTARFYFNEICNFNHDHLPCAGSSSTLNRVAMATMEVEKRKRGMDGKVEKEIAKKT